MTSQKIKKATFELVGKNGYEGTTLEEIAKMVGIKKPSIYAHFSGKEEIFFTVLEEEIHHFCAYMDEIHSGIEDDTEKNLMKFLKRYMDYFYKDQIKKEFWRNILFCPCILLKEKIKSSMIIFNEKIYTHLSYIMKQGIHNGDIQEYDLKDLIYSFDCLLQGNFTMLLLDQFIYENIEKNWNIYWNGIKKQG